MDEVKLRGVWFVGQQNKWKTGLGPVRSTFTSAPTPSPPGDLGQGTFIPLQPGIS